MRKVVTFTAILLFTVKSFANTINSGLNVNLKSKALSDILSPQTSDSSIVSSEEKKQINPPQLSSVISIDLEGEVETHLSSPKAPSSLAVYEDYVEPKVTEPIFRWGTISVPERIRTSLTKVRTTIRTKSHISEKGTVSCSNIVVPSIYIGAKYDFRKRWYGITSLKSCLSWGDVIVGNGPSKFISKLRSEISLMRPNDFKVGIDVQVPNEIYDDQNEFQNELGPMLSVNYISHVGDLKSHVEGNQRQDCTSFQAKAFIHPRVGVAIKAIVAGFNDEEARGIKFRNKKEWNGYFLKKIPQQKVSFAEGSWIPEVKVSPSGKVVANNSFGVQKKFLSKSIVQSMSNNFNNVGIRLMISKQMNWNLIGILQGENHDTENETIIRIEVGAAQDNCYSSIVGEGSLERLSRTWRCNLLQERLYCLE